MGIKVISENKKARFDYFLEETLEAGICLNGGEVKSAKLGHVNLNDSFCFIEKEEVFLKNCNITPYEKGSVFNTEAKRDRKLLLKKAEISRLIGKVREKGYTLVPVKLYFAGRYLKLEIALARGKHTYDKKATLKEKDIRREAERDIKNYIGR